MKLCQLLWTPAAGWSGGPHGVAGEAVQLVLTFGAPGALRQAALFAQLRDWFPNAVLAGCSTAGEIADTRVHDESLVATVVEFEHSTTASVVVPVPGSCDGRAAAQRIVHDLVRPGLRHVMIFCDGLAVNGSSIASALRESLPHGVCVTGGLAADADRFIDTLVACNGAGQSRQVLAIGFYGERLRVGYGSVGGWDTFGPARLVTRAKGPVLFELDGKSALELYKAYLGDYAAGLPASALRFPLLLEDGPPGEGLVRTVLGTDDASGSMRFGGDIPQGARVRLMKANFDRLVQSAGDAAAQGLRRLAGADAQLAVLVSCVGRRLVLRQRVEEELEAVRAVLGAAALAGFYSYGELCPRGMQGGCELHNQTMTVTTFAEA